MPPAIPLTPLEPWCAAKIGAPGRPLSPRALADYQLVRLQETLHLARTKNPFYREHLAHAPATLSSLEEIQDLPFTTAQDLRTRRLHFLCVSQDALQRVVTLERSGTTGPPKRIYFTRDDQALTVDFFHVGMATFTAPGDGVLILLPGAAPGSVGDWRGSHHPGRAGRGAVCPAGGAELHRHGQLTVAVTVAESGCVLAGPPKRRSVDSVSP